MGYKVRSDVQRLMQDATKESIGENTWLMAVDWAMKWWSFYQNKADFLEDVVVCEGGEGPETIRTNGNRCPRSIT